MSVFQVSVRDSLQEVVFKRPPLNTLNENILKELAEIFRSAKPHDARALLLRGDGAMFCNGIDPAEFLPKDDEGRAAIFWALLQCCIAALQCRLPIITDIHGDAMAGGAVLAALGDYVIVDAQKGKLCFSEIKVKLPVPYPIIGLGARRMQPRYTNDMFLLGRNFVGAEIESIGFAQAAYLTSPERSALIEDYVGRMTRLNADVVAETLSALRRPYLQAFLDFEPSFDMTLGHYLSDEYLGAGMKAILQGAKKT